MNNGTDRIGRFVVLNLQTAGSADEIMKRKIERGTREGINTVQLKALELPLALVDEQRRIVRILAAHPALLMEGRDQLKKHHAQRQGLMQGLLKGSVGSGPYAAIQTISQ